MSRKKDLIRYTLRNEHLLTMRSTGTTNQIKEAIEAADAASGEFAARRMDASIRKVLTGQNVNKV